MCEHCVFTANTLGFLKRHVDVMHKDSLQCPHCERKFPQMMHYEYHIEGTHLLLSLTIWVTMWVTKVESTWKNQLLEPFKSQMSWYKSFTPSFVTQIVFTMWGTKADEYPFCCHWLLELFDPAQPENEMKTSYQMIPRHYSIHPIKRKVRLAFRPKINVKIRYA